MKIAGTFEDKWRYSSGTELLVLSGLYPVDSIQYTEYSSIEKRQSLKHAEYNWPLCNSVAHSLNFTGHHSVSVRKDTQSDRG